MKRTQSSIHIPVKKMSIPDYENYGLEPHVKVVFIFATKIVKKSFIWSTLNVVRRLFNTALVNSSTNQTLKPEYADEFSFEYSFEEPQQQSELDKKITKLIEKGVINETYAVDLFKQEQIFKDNFQKLKEEQIKEVLVCGDEIFKGDDFEGTLKKARCSYPNRPFYSYSFKNEPMIL